jgi:type II secretory pathway component PulJ
MQLIGANMSNGNESGFTTIDLLVAAALSLVALAAFASFNRVQLFTLRNAAEQSEVQVTARNIVDLFSREVRRAGANPTCAAGISAISDAKQHLLEVQSDLDGDGTLTGPDEQVTYRYDFSNNELDRVANGNTDALIDGVTLAGSRIRYFDQAGTELAAGDTGLASAQRANVRRVRIELVVSAASANPYDPEPRRVTVANDVNLRNRYFANTVSCP